MRGWAFTAFSNEGSLTAKELLNAKNESSNSALPQAMNFRTSASPQFWMLSIFLVLVFIIGGASRIDVQSLLILRPASIIACALALLTLRLEHFARFKVLVAGFAVIFFLCLLHLVPLPPSLWQALPGREILSEIDHAAALGGVWRPLTMTPLNGWHSFLSLLTPLAVLLFGVQLNHNDQARLLPVILVMGAVSGLCGILQVIGSPNGPLYFYKITNNGSAVGLFSNRNHAAVFLACMFPMLATFASSATTTKNQQRSREMIALGALIVNVPLILVTGSRSGLAIGFVGMIAAALLYKRPEKARVVRRGEARWRVGPAPVYAGVAILCMGLLTLLFSRADAITRLFMQGVGEDTRGEYWARSIALIRNYFPWGSGLGSFVETYQIAEPISSLDPRYVNHAHNDWIEVVLTLGLPGAIILLAAVGIIARQSLRLWRGAETSRRDVRFGKLATVIIGMLALASITDYPLRTPSLMCFLMLCLLWLFAADRSDRRQGFQAGEVYIAG